MPSEKLTIRVRDLRVGDYLATTRRTVRAITPVDGEGRRYVLLADADNGKSNAYWRADTQRNIYRQISHANCPPTADYECPHCGLKGMD